MKKLLTLFSLSLLTILPQSSYAMTNKDGNAAYTTTAEYDFNDPMSWNQASSPYTGTFGTANRSFRLESCMIHVAAFVQIKIGNKPIGYTPTDVKAELDAVNGWGSGGYALYETLDWGSDWEIVPSESKRPYDAEYSYHIATYEDVERYWNEGYMVVMRVNSPVGRHQIAVDTITEDGRIVIFDSGFKAKYYDDVYKPSDLINVTLYRSKSGKRASDLPVLIDNRDGEQIYARLSTDEDPAKTYTELQEEAYAITDEQIAQIEGVLRQQSITNAIERILIKPESEPFVRAEMMNSLTSYEYSDFVTRLEALRQ